MDLVADGLLIAGALAAAFYCWVLSVRVRSLTDLDNGLGAAIATLSGKVDDMQKALEATRDAAGATVLELEEVTERAENAARRLEDLVKRSRQHAKRNPQPVATQDWDEPEEPVVEAVEKPQEEEAEQTAIVSAAERLQAQIRERLSSRSDGDTSDDIVQTLQNLLTANK